MTEIKYKNIIDCKDLLSDEINYEVKNLIFNKVKNIVLKNTVGKKGLLEGIKSNVKIEILGDVSENFANFTCGLKIIVNGSIGENSACGIKSGKITVFGSCEGSFGNNAESSEFYVLENCSKDSFSNLTKKSKIVLGGLINGGFSKNKNDCILIILNLQGGNWFLENGLLENIANSCVYIRGEKEKIKLQASDFILLETSYEDEDVYLPLISEFARQFNCSLSKIKSKPFYKVGAGLAPE